MSSVPWVPENQLTEWQADSSRCTFTIAIDISKAHRPIEFLKSTKKNIRKKKRNHVEVRCSISLLSLVLQREKGKTNCIWHSIWTQGTLFSQHWTVTLCLVKTQLYKYLYIVIFDRVCLKSLHICSHFQLIFSNLPFLQELIRVEWSHWP